MPAFHTLFGFCGLGVKLATLNFQPFLPTLYREARARTVPRNSPFFHKRDYACMNYCMLLLI